MGSPTAPRVENASRSHPNESNRPQNGSNRGSDEEPQKDQPNWEPPRHRKGPCIAYPILIGAGSLQLWAVATGGFSIGLNWWASDVPIGAEHATVAGLRLQYGFATLAVVEILACIRGHRFGFPMPARGTGNRGQGCFAHRHVGGSIRPVATTGTRANEAKRHSLAGTGFHYR